MTKSPLLSARDLSFRYGQKPIFEGLSLSILPGEIVGVLGPNGAGKTTLIKCLVGMERLRTGTIFFNERNVSAAPIWKRARLGMAYLSQGTSLMPELTVLENVALGVRSRTPRVDAANVLKRLDLFSEADKSPEQLSGGQRRLIELGRLFASTASLLILDEPFAMLDPISRGQISETIQYFSSQGRTILMTDHDVTSTLKLVERALVLIDGKVCFEGNPAKILQDTFVRAHYLGEGDTFS
jgi:lipopolysaccharide export system ATP-binding protein